jgi:hypothetical protein
MKTLSEIVRENVEERFGTTRGLDRGNDQQMIIIKSLLLQSQIALIEGVIEMLARVYKIVPIPATDRETLILKSYNTALSEVHDLLQEQLAIIKEIK